MANIKIEHLTDSHSCETCGSSYAEGARVFIDEELTLELVPVAHCFGGDDYQCVDIYARILRHLGHVVEDSHLIPDDAITAGKLGT